MRIPLTTEEKKIVEELLQLAGGMGCTKDVSSLNTRQRLMIDQISRKGHVTLTKKWFMVVLPP